MHLFLEEYNFNLAVQQFTETCSHTLLRYGRSAP